MSGFEDRQKGAEGKFANDAKRLFLATARRDKLLGLWVSETFLGKSGEEADSFAKEVVMANLEEPGDNDVVAFVLKSVAGTDADLSEHRLRHKMEELMREAERQISE
ncbi:MAG: DUF1476 domain-containing protein [Proteobacteria bacterium]|nr:DUF1476 domain-containing protein [Pseudomonadota bacterium]MDA1310309.1 DUF1476 domain-containing protein [Pseudomonadota bacterium]